LTPEDELHDQDEYQYSQQEQQNIENIASRINLPSTVYLDVHHYTQLTLKSKATIEQNPSDIRQCVLRRILSKLIQLVSPESLALKLPTFQDNLSRWLCYTYFYDQEHFTLENFIHLLTSENDDEDYNNNEEISSITTKVTIYTRTSSYITGLNKQSKQDLFENNVDVLNLATIENSLDLEEQFYFYENDEEKNVLLIVIGSHQRQHIPFVRELIDKIEYNYNHILQHFKRKHFIMLLHSPPTELYHQSCFPSIFLNNWDIYFFDTCAPGTSFHLQKMLQVLCSSPQQQQIKNNEGLLCDFNLLFDDSLWQFCSCLQIFTQDLPPTLDNCKNFYKRDLNIAKRVQCLNNTMKKCIKLQQFIVNTYHERLSSKNIYSMIYETAKQIVCGKKFLGLVDSISKEIHDSFTHFVSSILIYLVNDYGLETLSRTSSLTKNYEMMLNLIDYSFINE
ncbi:unnamed protein product, partial [Didymodactylos carnosus]